MFKCCKECVPPKREPGCHDRCPEYKEARAEYDKIKAAEKRYSKKFNDAYGQRDYAVNKALRKVRKRSNWKGGGWRG